MAIHLLLGVTVGRQQRAWSLVLLWTVAAALALSVWFTNHLYANDNQPDALGVIEGTVKDGNGQPVAGVQVHAWLRQIDTAISWSPRYTVITAADGSYRFTGLPVGAFRVSATDPRGRYGTTFYPAANVVQNARDLPVTGNTTTGVDLMLQPAGQIVATVALTPPYTATSTTLELYQQVTTSISLIWDKMQVVSLSPSGGVYTFTGLAANSYRVCAYSSGTEFIANECYDNVYALDMATTLPLTAGTTISNVLIILGDGANYAQIRGRVTDGNAHPLVNIYVYAWPVAESNLPFLAANNTRSAVPQRSATQQTSNDVQSYGFTRTNSNGEYVLSNLEAGQYRLQYRDPAGTYAFEFYNNKRWLTEATALAITAQEVISDINVQLDPAAYITGQVTLFAQSVPNTAVLADLQLTDGSWQTVAQTTTIPNTGQYRLNGLPAGTYRLWAEASIYDQISNYRAYGVYGGAALTEAVAIPLTTGANATNLNIAMHGPQFAGSLAGRVTANGTPVAGARVTLYNACCNPQQPPALVYTLTDVDGRYIFNGLADGTFAVGVSEPTGLYATTYYTNGIVPGSAKLLQTQDAKALTDVNIVLPLAGAISGRVQRVDGQVVAGLYVVLARYDTHSGEVVNLPIETYTNATGQYKITGLHPGEYTVCFKKQAYETYIECYGGVDAPIGGFGGQRVTVTASKTTSNVDLIWGPDLHSYIPIVRK